MANVEKLVGFESPLEVGQKINEIIEKGVGNITYEEMMDVIIDLPSVQTINGVRFEEI